MIPALGGFVLFMTLTGVTLYVWLDVLFSKRWGRK